MAFLFAAWLSKPVWMWLAFLAAGIAWLLWKTRAAAGTPQPGDTA